MVDDVLAQRLWGELDECGALVAVRPARDHLATRDLLHRFLQLARREGYEFGRGMRDSKLVFPILRTTTEPNVKQLNEGLWVRGDGEGDVFFFPSEEAAREWRGFGDAHLCTERTGIRQEWMPAINEVSVNHTVTREIEE
jgi:hypothetical protein